MRVFLTLLVKIKRYKEQMLYFDILRLFELLYVALIFLFLSEHLSLCIFLNIVLRNNVQRKVFKTCEIELLSSLSTGWKGDKRN